MSKLRLLFLALLVLAWTGQGRASEMCGALENHYGPFDYRTDKGKLTIVEQAHFTPSVESLTRGNTSTIGDDLAYTLRTFPNHHRALIAMMNLGFKLKTERAPGASHTVGCFFDRALRFRPDDPTVRMIYANYLSRHGKKDDAIKQLEIAQSLGASNANLDYNMGLAYFEVGDYEKSLGFAHRAYKGGFNLPGLKNKLVKAGKWRDAVPDVVPVVTKPADAEGDAKPEAPK